jgi:hypothetical protein
MDDGFVLPLKWSWRSQAKRCIQCGWLFSCAAWHEDRKRCLACTSKLGEMRLKPEPPPPPPAPPIRFGAKARLEDELRQAIENTARMQPAGEREDP